MGKHSINNKCDKKEYNKNSKSKNIGKIILRVFIVILLILAILAGIAFALIKNKLSKMQLEKIDEKAIGISAEIEEELAEYRNIALFGIDSRADDYGLGNRSDTIIIASINQKTKDIKLISVYRDTYMQVKENGNEVLDKVTHAYSYGGAQNALKSLNTNLDLNISEYVTVNFDSMVDVIQALGGITINVQSEEINYINKYIDETSRVSKVSSTYITNSGNQVLDGVQAVSYARVRYTAGGDYKRAERARTVIDAMIKKAKTLSISELNKLADTILPEIRTNITANEILGLIPSLSSFNIVESLGWPYETKGITLAAWYGVPVTLESNVLRLHKELFEQEDYEVSDKVKEISNKIINKTGYNN